jgi:hypothetical protein
MDHDPISEWKEPRRLGLLAEFFERDGLSATLSDSAFISRIRETYWPTNVSCYLQEVLAIASHACSLRPHLASQLLRDLVDPMLAGGLEDPDNVGRHIESILAETTPYVPLSASGRQWLDDNIEVVNSLLIAEAKKAIATAL